MTKITVEVPATVQVGRGGIHGQLTVDWSKVPQHMLDHIASVHFPQWFSDSFNAGGAAATSEERMAAAQKKLDQLYAGELRTRSASSEPIDPVGREAFGEARKAIAKMLQAGGYWKDIPQKTSNRLQYVLNKAQRALGDEETSDVEYIEWFLADTDVGKAIVKEAVKTVARRNKMADSLPMLRKTAKAAE